MDASKEYLKNNDIVPRISFKDSPKHTVKLVKDKIDTIMDDKGQKVDGVKYLVEESGDKKTFFTSSDSLIQKLSDVSAGTEVTIEMKSKKTDAGFRTYFTVTREGEKEEEAEDGLPVNSDIDSF